MELTRHEVIELNNVLGQTDYDPPISSRFRYMVSKNLAATKKEIDEINSAFPVPIALEEYKKARSDTLLKYKVKSDAEYKELPTEPKKSLDNELDALNVKFKPLLDELEATDKEKDIFLKETVDIPLIKAKLDVVPTISRQNKINGWNIWHTLMKVIEDE